MLKRGKGHAVLQQAINQASEERKSGKMKGDFYEPCEVTRLETMECRDTTTILQILIILHMASIVRKKRSKAKSRYYMTNLTI